MYLFITITCVVLSIVSAQHYNYPRPKTPFPLVSRGQAHGHQQGPRAINGPTQTFVVRTVGPNRHAYEVQMLKSQQLYEGRVTNTVPSNHLNYAPPPPPPQHQHYHHQQHQQQQQQHHHHHQQPLPYTVNSNPLIQSPPVSYAGPASAAGPAPLTYGPPNYTPPAPISYNSPSTGQLPVSYGPPNSPPPPPPVAAGPPASLPPTSAHPNSPQHNAARYQLMPIPPINPEPYAVVQLPNGAQVQDGGHGAGGHRQSGTGSRTGNYHAQSQASQLDYYDYKQNPAGDARDYQRYITTCSPDGQCQRVAVSPGQAEPGHQQFLIDARAHTAPSQDNCKRFVDARAAQEAASGGASFRGSSSSAIGAGAGGGAAADGQRPPNRRYYQYTETVRARDPYN